MLDGFSRETCLERKSGFSVCRWNCRGLRPLSLSITAMIEKRSCRAHIHWYHFDTTTISNSWSARHLSASFYPGFFPATKPLSVPTPCSIDSQLFADARHELFETAFWEDYSPSPSENIASISSIPFHTPGDAMPPGTDLQLLLHEAGHCSCASCGWVDPQMLPSADHICWHFIEIIKSNTWFKMLWYARVIYC